MMRVRGRGESPEDINRDGGVNNDGGGSRGKDRGQWDGWGLEKGGKRPAGGGVQEMRWGGGGVGGIPVKNEKNKISIK